MTAFKKDFMCYDLKTKKNKAVFPQVKSDRMLRILTSFLLLSLVAESLSLRYSCHYRYRSDPCCYKERTHTMSSRGFSVKSLKWSLLLKIQAQGWSLSLWWPGQVVTKTSGRSHNNTWLGRFLGQCQFHSPIMVQRNWGIEAELENLSTVISASFTSLWSNCPAWSSNLK